MCVCVQEWKPQRPGFGLGFFFSPCIGYDPGPRTSASAVNVSSS